MIRTKGLTHIHLLVGDIQRSLAFYGSVLGAKEMFREGPEMIFIRTPGTSDLITLHESADAAVGTSAGVRHFGFILQDTADIDEAARTVEAAGGKVLRKGEHSPGHPFLYVADPDGYVIEFDA